MLFDTHAHYDDERFLEDLEEVMKKASENGVSYILNASSSPESIDKTIGLAERFESIYAAVGIHPHDASKMDEKLYEKMKGLLSHAKVVAVGEIGLDYHYDFSPREVQKKWLVRQIELAKETKYPIIIHNRESSEDMMNILKETSAKEVGGIFHCFSGSIEMAKVLLASNFYLSFGGPITFKNAKKALEVLSYLPLDRILLETDSPYLTPEPHRGKRNDSSYLKIIAEKLAEIKKITFEEVAAITTKNALTVFGIKK